MCCLFGFHDYGHCLSRKQRSRLLSILSTACEERGTDATGISYNVDGRQVIFKRSLPAHRMRYRVPARATVVMGHTRMTTQGSEKQNFNNHPFPGCAGGTVFFLAHNGVLVNDKLLRKERNLPDTKIETDSYVAVQLLEKFGKMDFDGLRAMAEALEGSFTMTTLTDRDELYFVRGNNPMCIYHYPQAGIYIYASTEEILCKAIRIARLPLGQPEQIRTFSGELLRIDARGKIARSQFDDSRLYPEFLPWTHWEDCRPVRLPCSKSNQHSETSQYLEDLKSVGACYGLYPEDIDDMLADGLSFEEIEEYLYCG